MSDQTTSDQELAVELAWGIIANAYGGDWDRATEEWRTAAAKWRDRFVGQIEGSEEIEPSAEEAPS